MTRDIVTGASLDLKGVRLAMGEVVRRRRRVRRASGSGRGPAEAGDDARTAAPNGGNASSAGNAPSEGDVVSIDYTKNSPNTQNILNTKSVDSSHNAASAGGVGVSAADAADAAAGLAAYPHVAHTTGTRDIDLDASPTDTRSVPLESESTIALERGLRGLVGSGSTQVSPTAALRARDAARPRPDDVTRAESDLVIIRRHWTPRSP